MFAINGYKVVATNTHKRLRIPLHGHLPAVRGIYHSRIATPTGQIHAYRQARANRFSPAWRLSHTGGVIDEMAKILLNEPGLLRITAFGEDAAGEVYVTDTSGGAGGLGRIHKIIVDTDCNANSTPDDQDIAKGTSDDCDADGIPDECQITDGSAQDCNGNEALDACEIASGASDDLNGNGIPDECDPDTDTDGLSDECDPCAGGAASGDSDANGSRDLDDYADFEPCLNGVNGGLGTGCECFDFDSDNDVDLENYAEFQVIFDGP